MPPASFPSLSFLFLLRFSSLPLAQLILSRPLSLSALENPIYLSPSFLPSLFVFEPLALVSRVPFLFRLSTSGPCTTPTVMLFFCFRNRMGLLLSLFVELGAAEKELGKERTTRRFQYLLSLSNSLGRHGKILDRFCEGHGYFLLQITTSVP